MLQFLLTGTNLSNKNKQKTKKRILNVYHQDDMTFCIDGFSDELSNDSAPTMRSPSPDRNGLLRFEGRATRAGIFDYRRADGSIKKVLRRPSEVKKYLKTLAGSIITDEHPAEPVTIDNASDLAVGMLNQTVVWEQDVEDGYAKVQGVIYNKDSMRSVMSGEKSELSCGYFADHIDEPGTWTNYAGEKMHYDSEMVNMKNNHLAHVKKGRAGPEGRIQIDHEDIIEVERIKQPKRKKMIQFSKGKSVRKYNQDEEDAIQRAVLDLEDDLTESDVKIASQAEEIVALKASVFKLESEKTLSETEAVSKDSAMEELKTENTRLKSVEVTDEDIQNRVELLEAASELKLDSVKTMTSFDIKKALCAVKLPQITEDSEDFRAKVEMGYQIIKDSNTKVSPLEKAVKNLIKSETIDDTEDDSDDSDETASEEFYRSNMYGAK